MPFVQACAEGLSKVCRKKTLSSERDMYETPLQRSLTTFQLVLMGLGLMIGSGLYVLTGVVARDVTGPAIVISYGIAAVASLLSAFCFVEFACAIPRTGSAYTFTYIAVGEIWAFLIGWNMIIEYAIGASSVSSALIGYVDFLAEGALTNFTIDTIMGGHLWEVPFLAPYPGIFPALLLVLLTIPILIGTRLSSYVNGVLISINIAVVSLIVIAGFTKANINNWTEDGGFAPYGIAGILSGSATVFFSYFGFDVIAIANEETINPKESVPKATFLAVSITCACYILSSAVLTLMIPYGELNEMSAFAEAFKRTGIVWASWVVGVGAMCAMFTTIILNMYSLPRILYAIASDGLLFSFLGKVNPTTRVPVNSTLVSLFLSVVLALFFSLAQLVEFLSIGGLLGYAFVAGSVIALRYKPLQHLDFENEGITNISPKKSTITSTLKIEDGVDQNELAGTLKHRYRSLPVLHELARFQPGLVVNVSVCMIVVFEIIAVVLVKYQLRFIIAGAWWPLLLLFVCITGSLLAFFLMTLFNQNPGNAEYYKAPFVPLLPVLSIMCNVTLAVNLKSVTWIRFGVWMIIGSLVYVAYGYRHSKEGQSRQEGVYVELTHRSSGCPEDGNTYGSTES